MEIVNRLKEKPPKFVYEDWLKEKPQANASQLEIDRFVDRELNRWVKGWGGITGRHYAYLTQGSLKTVTGKIIRPRWRDGDELIFEEREKAIQFGEDEMIVKRREFGLTSNCAGFEPIYTAIVNPGSISLITSADRRRVENAFSDKVIPMYDGLDDWFRPGRISEKMAGYLHMGEKDDKGMIRGINSKVVCLETSSSDKNAKSFENYRAMYIFLDELFLHARAPIVHKSSQACLKQGFVKKGHMIFGGSCGAESAEEAEMLKKGAMMGEQLWADAKTLRIRTIFLPGTLCIEEAPEFDKDGNPTGRILNFCKNGYSDQKGALEWIERERDRLDKAKDKDHYYNFIKQYPVSIDEVFEINRAAIFPKEVYDNLNRAKKDYYSEGNVGGPFTLYRKDGLIVKEPDKKGKFIIMAEPQASEEYIGGIDPIPFGTANVNEGSDHALLIKGRMSEEYVAYYSERNLDSDIVIENCILLQEYFKSQRFPNGALVNIESNRAEVALKTYEQKGKLHLLSNKPTHLGIEYVDKKTKKGWFNNDKTEARGNNYIVEFLKKYAIKLRLLKLIEEIIRFPNGNNDLFDAMRSCEILDNELREIDKKKYIPPQSRKQRYITRDSHGRTIEVWKNVPVR